MYTHQLTPSTILTASPLPRYYITTALFDDPNRGGGGWLTKYNLPWVWTALFLTGLVLLISVRNPLLKRFAAERAAAGGGGANAEREKEEEEGLLGASSSSPLL